MGPPCSPTDRSLTRVCVSLLPSPARLDKTLRKGFHYSRGMSFHVLMAFCVLRSPHRHRESGVGGENSLIPEEGSNNVSLLV